MKVLFAVNNENMSNQIVKRYQKEYKEIISYKNMYYFNAIIKELQRDKSYDRIVISEDLEPFANNNYDAIDKFLFEKLDNITDEAAGTNGEDIPIILISTDRRTKSEPILVKLFGIGIYNALLGQDRSAENVCKLLNKPRSKKEAKIYYKIESDEVNYKSESEENVSEAEIKNILYHYRRLGKDEEKYIESFNNIAAQYNDAQLRIITKFLPLNVKAVLEEKSPKYQSVMTFGETTPTINTAQKQKESDGLKIGFLNNNSNRPVNPVIVPTALKKVAIKKAVNNINMDVQELPKTEETENYRTVDSIQEEADNNIETVEPIKKKRGRPKKNVDKEEIPQEETVKKKRGRPKKIVEEQSNYENSAETILPGFDDVEEILPGLDEFESETMVTEADNIEKVTLPGFDDAGEETTLPGFDDLEKDDILTKMNKSESMNNLQQPLAQQSGIDQRDIESSFNNNSAVTNYNAQENYNSNKNNISGLLSKDKKIVSFIGTTKNGTSFLVNNVAKCLSAMGIKTAILDLTTNRNSYYIYTKNEEQLRNVAFESIKKLRSGITNGIVVDKNLDVFTALPGDNLPLEDVNGIITPLLQNYSVVLMDCDFNTNSEYFGVAQEIYIVQTMDILTIQPMTAFLRDLKAKDILNPEKIRIIINKEVKVRGLTAKAIIGGLAYYNDPAMSFMTELFNKDTVKYCTIPFEEDIYSRYLEGVMECEITINGYSKNFNMKLKELANMVYPLLNNKYKPIGDYSSKNKFSPNMNNTLEQMKNKY